MSRYLQSILPVRLFSLAAMDQLANHLGIQVYVHFLDFEIRKFGKVGRIVNIYWMSDHFMRAERSIIHDLSDIDPFLRPMTDEEEAMAISMFENEVKESGTYPDCAIRFTIPEPRPFKLLKNFLPYHFSEEELAKLPEQFNFFKQVICTEFGKDPQCYESIASLSYDMYRRCLECVPELSGFLSKQIRECLQSPFLGTPDGKKIYIEGELIQIDRNGSYPATYVSMPGIPQGMPSAKFNPAAAYYYEKIRVKSFRCKHSKDPYPLLNSTGEFWLDKTTIECINEHYEWEKEVICGWYFKKIHDMTSFRQLTQKLWDFRRRYSNIQNLFKWMMNTVWGISVRKPPKEIKKTFDAAKFREHFEYIDEFTQKDGQYEVKIPMSVNFFWGMPQFGVNVMSWHRKEMADLIYRCIDHGIDVYYVNTDSIMIGAALSRIGVKIGAGLGEWKIDKEIVKFICISPKKWFMKLKDGSTQCMYGVNDEEYWERKYGEN
jgi:hypothetical protein